MKLESTYNRMIIPPSQARSLITKKDVLKSWTKEDEKGFESLVALNLLSSVTKFWKLTMEYFPSKSIGCMMNYYYNVYIPRCMSIEEKISFWCN